MLIYETFGWIFLFLQRLKFEPYVFHKRYPQLTRNSRFRLIKTLLELHSFRAMVFICLGLNFAMVQMKPLSANEPTSLIPFPSKCFSDQQAISPSVFVLNLFVQLGLGVLPQIRCPVYDRHFQTAAVFTWLVWLFFFRREPRANRRRPAGNRSLALILTSLWSYHKERICW